MYLIWDNLPGGSHGIATKAGTTVRAIKEGLKLLKKKGLLTLCIYSGGDSGFEEKETVLSFLKKLNPREFLVIQAEYINRPQPSAHTGAYYKDLSREK